MFTKVAIITRTRNRGILLKRAINSAKEQTYTDWHMYIVNDVGDLEIVENVVKEFENEIQEKITVLDRRISTGMESASNHGIKNSDSKYVIIHDDDDSWHPLFLEKTVGYLEEHSESKGVITHTHRIVEKIENDKVIIVSNEPFNTWLEKVNLFRMAAENVFPPISFLYRRDCFAEIGYYDETLPVLGDWDFNLRFLNKYEIEIVPEPLAYYHHRVEITNGDLSNSVIGGNNKHLYYDNYLRNQYLREDMEKGKVGLGYLVNIAKADFDMHKHLNYIQGNLSDIGMLAKIARVLFKITGLNYALRVYKKIFKKH